jgi:hypothetical protein
MACALFVNVLPLVAPPTLRSPDAAPERSTLTANELMFWNVEVPTNGLITAEPRATMWRPEPVEVAGKVV